MPDIVERVGEGVVSTGRNETFPEIDPANAACDYQTATCDYWADRSGLDPGSCAELISLPASLSAERSRGAMARAPLP